MDASMDLPTVLVLTPVKDVSRCLDDYCESSARMGYQPWAAQDIEVIHAPA